MMRPWSTTVLFWIFVVFNFVQISQSAVASANSASKYDLPTLLQKYLLELKSIKSLRNSKNDFRNELETYKRDDAPIKLPDGEPPEPAVGPGNPPRSKINSVADSKRSEDEDYDMTCKEHEWFVFIDDMPACGEYTE